MIGIDAVAAHRVQASRFCSTSCNLSTSCIRWCAHLADEGNVTRVLWHPASPTRTPRPGSSRLLPVTAELGVNSVGSVSLALSQRPQRYPTLPSRRLSCYLSSAAHSRMHALQGTTSRAFCNAPRTSRRRCVSVKAAEALVIPEAFKQVGPDLHCRLAPPCCCCPAVLVAS